MPLCEREVKLTTSDLVHCWTGSGDSYPCYHINGGVELARRSGRHAAMQRYFRQKCSRQRVLFYHLADLPNPDHYPWTHVEGCPGVPDVSFRLRKDQPEHDVVGNRTVQTVFPWQRLGIRQETGVASAAEGTAQRRNQSGYTIVFSFSFVDITCAGAAASSRTVWTSPWCSVAGALRTSTSVVRHSPTQMPSRPCLLMMTSLPHPEKETSLGEQANGSLEYRPISCDVRVDSFLMDQNVCPYSFQHDVRKTDITVCFFYQENVPGKPAKVQWLDCFCRLCSN
eukprot:4607918-Amphidinium_carterae.1